jgi:hypothetical protein
MIRKKGRFEGGHSRADEGEKKPRCQRGIGAEGWAICGCLGGEGFGAAAAAVGDEAGGSE